MKAMNCHRINEIVGIWEGSNSNTSKILLYLLEFFKQELQYRAINNHRYAISAFRELIQGKPTTESSAKTKYFLIWNLRVFYFIRNEWVNNLELSDYKLSYFILCYELMMLLVLTSASCAAFENKSYDKDSWDLHVYCLQASQIKHGERKITTYYNFFFKKKDVSWCVVTIFNGYLEN